MIIWITDVRASQLYWFYYHYIRLLGKVSWNQ